jgi:hypothetical protein
VFVNVFGTENQKDPIELPDNKSEENINLSELNLVEENMKEKIDIENIINEESKHTSLIYKINYNNFPYVLQYLDNKEIQALRITSKYFYQNMKNMWQMRLKLDNIFNNLIFFDDCLHVQKYSDKREDETKKEHSIEYLFHSKVLKDVPEKKIKFQLADGYNEMGIYLEEKFDTSSSIKPGDLVEVDINLLEKMRKMEKELFTPSYEYSDYSVTIGLIYLRRNQQLEEINYEIQEITKDKLNNIEMVKIIAIGAIETQTLGILKNGLNFIQNWNQETEELKIGNRIKFTNVKELENILIQELKQYVIPYNTNAGFDELMKTEIYTIIAFGHRRFLVKDIQFDEERNTQKYLLSVGTEKGVINPEESDMIPNDDDFWFLGNDPNTLKKRRTIRKKISVLPNSSNNEDISYTISMGKEIISKSTYLKSETDPEKQYCDNILNANLFFELELQDDDECKLKIIYSKNDTKNTIDHLMNPISFGFMVDQFLYPIQFVK